MIKTRVEYTTDWREKSPHICENNQWVQLSDKTVPLVGPGSQGKVLASRPKVRGVKRG